MWLSGSLSRFGEQAALLYLLPSRAEPWLQGRFSHVGALAAIHE
jgi:hypothetical protein